MKKLNQKGLGTVEIILIIVIVGLLGGVGWYVWSKNKTDTPLNQTGNSVQSNPASINKTTENKSAEKKEPSDITKNWLTYTTPGKEFSIKVPDGWNLETVKGETLIYAFSANDIKYQAGDEATVKTIVGGRDYASIAFILGYSSKYKATDHSFDVDRATKQKTFKTNDGATVTRYYYFQQNDPQTMDIPKGTKQYTYVIISDGHSIHVTHDVLKGESDQVKNIELMLKTSEFLK